MWEHDAMQEAQRRAAIAFLREALEIFLKRAFGSENYTEDQRLTYLRDAVAYAKKYNVPTSDIPGALGVLVPLVD